MVIDCHTHIFPPPVGQDRGPYLTLDPAFRILYSSSRAKLVEAKGLLEEMDRCGVERAVVLGFPWNDPDLLRRHNDYLGEEAGRSGGRLIPFVCADPRTPSGADEVERCLRAGVGGVGELAFYAERLDDRVIAGLTPIAASCRAYKVPIMLHANEPVGHDYPGKAEVPLGSLYGLIRAFPENRFILAHWGGGLFVYELLKKEARDVLARVAYDTAASPFLYEPAVYSVAVRIVGAKRILFGSDFPLISPQRYFVEMAGAGLSKEDEAWIKGRAAAHWLGLASEGKKISQEGQEEGG
jgi:predicted TIM-barrel fold metal-dependent hydrolase